LLKDQRHAVVQRGNIVAGQRRNNHEDPQYLALGAAPSFP
jgi:hypothetical protein